MIPLPLAVKRLLHLEGSASQPQPAYRMRRHHTVRRGRVGTGFADTPALLHEHGVFVEIRQRGRLQSAEAEIQIIHMGVRTREQMGIGSPLWARRTIQQYPPGYGGPSIFANLSQASPAASSSVCPSSSRDSGALSCKYGYARRKQAVRAADTATHAQGRQQMRMEMVDGNKRFVARQRKPFCKGHADKQGPAEPGTAGHP